MTNYRGVSISILIGTYWNLFYTGLFMLVVLYQTCQTLFQSLRVYPKDEYLKMS